MEKPAHPMQGHVGAVAVLHIVAGSLVAIALLVILASLGLAGGVTSMFAPSDAATVVGGTLLLVGLFMVLVLLPIALCALIGGLLLLRRRRAGRTLVFISSAVLLLGFPVGTALGVYSFWALSRPGLEQFWTEAQP